MYRLKIDSSKTSHLPICECGWRGQIQASLIEAWTEARAHEERAHTGQIQALRALIESRRRLQRVPRHTGPGRQRG